jgi:hypothetical protein
VARAADLMPGVAGCLLWWRGIVRVCMPCLLLRTCKLRSSRGSRSMAAMKLIMADRWLPARSDVLLLLRLRMPNAAAAALKMPNWMLYPLSSQPAD